MKNQLIFNHHNKPQRNILSNERKMSSRQRPSIHIHQSFKYRTTKPIPTKQPYQTSTHTHNQTNLSQLTPSPPNPHNKPPTISTPSTNNIPPLYLKPQLFSSPMVNIHPYPPIQLQYNLFTKFKYTHYRIKYQTQVEKKNNYIKQPTSLMDDTYPNFKNRQFICACGKNYLSYAALFTHIKQKHEGKAPGPITRPRSQRKRGRPRKNPHNEHSGSNICQDMINIELGHHHNGILKGIDINNNNQKQEKQEKTKKAAEMLGCGNFAAFTAYKPDPAKPICKVEHESSKKGTGKKAVNDGNDRKHPMPFNLLSAGNEQHRYGINILVGESVEEVMDFCFGFEALNKVELKKIFQPMAAGEEEKQLQLRYQDFPVYKEINISDEVPRAKMIDIGAASISAGVSQFLRQIKNALGVQNQTKVEQSNSDNEQAAACHSFSQEFQQCLLLMLLLLESFVRYSRLTPAELNTRNISQLQLHFRKFVVNSLPKTIIQNSLQGYRIFQNANPTKFLLVFCNWLVLKKTQFELVDKNKVDFQLENGFQEQQPKFKIEESNQKQSEERLIHECLHNVPSEFRIQEK